MRLFLLIKKAASVENQAASMPNHIASTENKALQGTATWPTTGQAPACINTSGYPLATQSISTVCAGPLGAATWISMESPTAPNYCQYMDEPGLLVDMQPVFTWSVALSWVSMEQSFISGL